MNGAELRAKMQRGERVFGTMTSVARNPRWASAFALLGFDYVIVDTEHSPTGRSEAADLAGALLGVGVCPILRVKDSEPHATVMALDAGFQGVLVPYCETAEEVRAAVSAARLRPLKGRLHDRARDTGEFPSAETQRYLQERNENITVIVGIESVPAIENLEGILDVGGIDAIFIGPHDLAISLGIPDQYTHPRFVEATDYIISTAQARGVPAGGHWQTPDQTLFWLEKGSRWILYSSDMRTLIEGYRVALGTFRDADVSSIRHVDL